MKNQLFTLFGMVCSITALSTNTFAQCWTQVGENITGEQQYENTGTATCLSSNGMIVATGSPQFNMSDGRVRVFSWNGNSWEQMGSDIVSSDSDDRFGTALDLDATGSILAVGGSRNAETGQNTGAVQIFEWIDGAWIQKGSTIYGNESGQGFGKQIEISDDGTTLAVGAPFRSLGPNDYTTIGLTRVYRWNTDSLDWIQMGQDLVGFEDGDWFGQTLALTGDGNLLAVGANFSSHFSEYGGYLSLYSWNGSTWESVTIFEGEANEGLGEDVDITPNGNTLIISASSASANGMNSGNVLVYDYLNGNWMLRGNVPGESANVLYGSSVAINESGTIFCAGGNNGISSPDWAYRGFINTYFWNGSDWEKIGDDIEGATNVEMFGSDVAISYDGNTIAGGAKQSDYTVENSGHTAVYHSCVASTVSIESSEYYIFPNPASTEIMTISLPQGKHVGKVTITDITGRIVYNTEMNCDETFSLSLDVIPGTYHVFIAENSEYHSLVWVKK